MMDGDVKRSLLRIRPRIRISLDYKYHKPDDLYDQLFIFSNILYLDTNGVKPVRVEINRKNTQWK
jgi:hypothetical protein